MLVREVLGPFAIIRMTAAAHHSPARSKLCLIQSAPEKKDIREKTING
jgi:hypothetical protein